MNITCGSFSDSLKRTFYTWEEFISIKDFDSIRWLTVENCGCKFSIDISILPDKLEDLVITGIHILDFPVLPISLVNLTLRSVKLDHVPDVSYLTNLESISFKDNYIKEIIHPLPSNIRTMDFSYNQLTTFDYTLIPKYTVSVDLSFNFLTKRPPISGCVFDIDQNNFPPRKKFIQRPQLDVPERDDVEVAVGVHNQNRDDVEPQLNPGIYNNSQNVHETVIQKSASDAIGKLMLMYPDVPYDPKYIYDLIESVYDRLFSERIPRLILGFKLHPVYSWTKEQSLHSRQHVSYDKLLERVWIVIRMDTHRNELQKRLREELHESEGMCFTGKITRIVNVFTGFNMGLDVKVSDRHQLQFRIGKVVDAFTTGKCSCVEAKCDVGKILDEHDIIGDEREEWLSAFDDFEEEECDNIPLEL